MLFYIFLQDSTAMAFVQDMVLLCYVSFGVFLNNYALFWKAVVA